ncbi:MAG TPA: PAS domain S-box protein [Chthoniobacteraceae bacterium]|jgi:PAS domain S-box-containing protein|nr:PAS domain S-box protein [Chthoniobacteraceae bacterium]
MRISLYDPEFRLGDLARRLQACSPQFTIACRASLAELLAEAKTDDVLICEATPAPEFAGLLSRLRAAAPQAAIVVLIGEDQEEWWPTAIRLGAHECLSIRNSKAEELAEAIKRALVRRDCERPLRDQLRRLTQLVENIPDRVFFKDEESRFLEINRALALRFGLADRAEAVGRNDADFFSAAHVAAMGAHDQRIMRTGEPLLGQLEREEMPDGSSGWVLTSKLPLRDSRGVVVGTFGISHDVTEWRRAEEAVRESEERYRRLLDSITDYVYTVETRDGHAVSTSHGPGCLAVTGHSVEAFRDDPLLWYRIIHPADRDLVLQSIRRLMLDGEPQSIEHRLVHANGAVRWVRNKQVLRRGSSGDLAGYDGLISDITERKEAEEDLAETNAKLNQVLFDLTRSHEELQTAQRQLIEAEKFHAVGQLAAGVAHEVKNPLAILQVGLEYFTENLPRASGTDDVLREMRKAVDDATSVVSDLLHVATVEDVDPRLVAVNAMVQEALRVVSPSLATTGIKVVTDLQASGHLCQVDPAKITHSFVQVLLNACDAMPSGGTLRVSTLGKPLQIMGSKSKPGDRSGRFLRQGDPVVVVEISDTGIGIPADKLSRVFDPFYTTKKTGQGKGLGLSVAKSVINLYRGEMTISSAEGSGSTVTIVLPNGGQEVSVARL